MIDTLSSSPQDNAQRVMAWLRGQTVLEPRRLAAAGARVVV